MRKYNMCSENQTCENAFNDRSFRGCNNLPPFFDVPCLYYPQYPCNWNCSNQCENSYAIFCISAAENGENSLNFNLQAQDGRNIKLSQNNNEIILFPGKLYLVSYHLQAQINNIFGVIPTVDENPDLCNTSYIGEANSNPSNQSLSGTFLLPIVETPSTLQLQIPTGITVPNSLTGSLSVVALGNI